MNKLRFQPQGSKVIIPLLAVLLVAATACGIYCAFTSRYHPLIWDFHPLWAGTRALLFKGLNPYSAEATREIQIQMYGRPAEPPEDDEAFAYPLFIVYVTAPFALLPHSQATAAWLAVLLFALLSGLLLNVRTWNWHPPPWLLGLTVFWGLAFYPHTWSLILGQVSIVIFALMTTAVWALKTEHDRLAGVCLALSAIKPQMTFLLIPALLVWGIWRRRWAFLVTFGVAMTLLVASALAIIPTWISDLWKVMGLYMDYTPFKSPLQLLAEACYSPLGPVLTTAFTLVLLGFVAYVWWQNRDEGAAIDWAVAMVIIVTNLSAPRTSLVNQVALILPTILMFSVLSTRWWRSKAAIAVIQIASMILFWALFAFVVPHTGPKIEQYTFEHKLLSPILPLSLVAVLAAGWRLFVRAEVATQPQTTLHG
jgi:hypothetical protein